MVHSKPPHAFLYNTNNETVPVCIRRRQSNMYISDFEATISLWIVRSGHLEWSISLQFVANTKDVPTTLTTADRQHQAYFITDYGCPFFGTCTTRVRSLIARRRIQRRRHLCQPPANVRFSRTSEIVRTFLFSWRRTKQQRFPQNVR